MTIKKTHDKEQRKVLKFENMIIPGEGNEPIAPSLKLSSVIIEGLNSIIMEFIIYEIMGFDFYKIPYLKNLLYCKKLYL